MSRPAAHYLEAEVPLIERLECGCEIEGDIWFISGRCEEHGFGKHFPPPALPDPPSLARFEHDA